MIWLIRQMIEQAKANKLTEVVVTFKKDSELRAAIIYQLIFEHYTVDIIDERKIKIKW